MPILNIVQSEPVMPHLPFWVFSQSFGRDNASSCARPCHDGTASLSWWCRIGLLSRAWNNLDLTAIASDCAVGCVHYIRSRRTSMPSNPASHWLSISGHPHLCPIWNIWQWSGSVSAVEIFLLFKLKFLVKVTKLLCVCPLWNQISRRLWHI